MLHVPGTKTAASAQPVPMTADLVAELRAHRSRVAGEDLRRVHGDALLFQTTDGKQHDRKCVLRAIWYAGDQAKLNRPGLKRVGCHDLRHSCASLLLSAGVPAPRVAAILRHSDTRTLLTVYAGVLESERSELRADLARAFR